MIRGAGILFLTPQNQVLFLKRGPGGDFPGQWCLPGGKQEEGETLEQCAAREAREETGYLPAGECVKLCTTKAMGGSAAVLPDGADLLPGEAAPGETVIFTTYVQRVREPFLCMGDNEHVGCAWAPADQPPEPLHPAVRIALARMTMNELDIARAMAAGEMASPQRYGNITLWAMRITGTGASIRSPKKDKKTGEEIKAAEYVWRRPDLYLNDEFLARCNGLPVIWNHPEKATLDSKEWGDRAIGTIMLPFIGDGVHHPADEVWGIAKVFDDTANVMMEKAQLSTSPTVVLGDLSDPDIRLTAEDGKKILVEGPPRIVDHVAICMAGVWDKGGKPKGVLNETIGDEAVADMISDAEEQARKDAVEKEKADRAKADADMREGMKGLADSMKAMSDAFTKRMDANEAKMDSLVAVHSKPDASCRQDGETEEQYKERSDKARKDAEECAAKEKADAEEKARKDAEEKAREDSAKADAVRAAELDAIRKEVADMASRMKPRTADERRDFSRIQAMADSAYSWHGQQAAAPMDGETLHDYRRRLITPLKAHSPAWKDINLDGIADDAAFGPIEAQIVADAIQAGKRPAVSEGRLMAHETRTPGGHTIIEYHGSPRWMDDFAGPRQRAIGAFKE